MSKAVARLKRWREDWQEAAGNRPLTEVKAPVGLVLADVAEMLELSPDETEEVLGIDLADRLNIENEIGPFVRERTR